MTQCHRDPLYRRHRYPAERLGLRCLREAAIVWLSTVARAIDKKTIRRATDQHWMVLVFLFNAEAVFATKSLLRQRLEKQGSSLA